MCSDQQPEHSFLRSALDDGARQFLYRSRVRSLLGMPYEAAGAEGVLTLPPVAFRYTAHRADRAAVAALPWSALSSTASLDLEAIDDVTAPGRTSRSLHPELPAPAAESRSRHDEPAGETERIHDVETAVPMDSPVEPMLTLGHAATVAHLAGDLPYSTPSGSIGTDEVTDMRVPVPEVEHLAIPGVSTGKHGFPPIIEHREGSALGQAAARVTDGDGRPNHSAEASALLAHVTAPLPEAVLADHHGNDLAPGLRGVMHTDFASDTPRLRVEDRSAVPTFEASEPDDCVSHVSGMGEGIWQRDDTQRARSWSERSSAAAVSTTMHDAARSASAAPAWTEVAADGPTIDSDEPRMPLSGAEASPTASARSETTERGRQRRERAPGTAMTMTAHDPARSATAATMQSGSTNEPTVDADDPRTPRTALERTGRDADMREEDVVQATFVQQTSRSITSAVGVRSNTGERGTRISSDRLRSPEPDTERAALPSRAHRCAARETRYDDTSPPGELGRGRERQPLQQPPLTPPLDAFVTTNASLATSAARHTNLDTERPDRDSADRIEQLRNAIHTLVSKTAGRLATGQDVLPEEVIYQATEEQAHSQPASASARQVVIVQRSAPTARATRAFWERSYLRHVGTRIRR